jgi:hypothetical protein
MAIDNTSFSIINTIAWTRTTNRTAWCHASLSLPSQPSKQSISTQQGKQAHSGNSKPATDRDDRGLSKQPSRYLATVGEGEGRIQARESRFRPAAARFWPPAEWATPGGGGGCAANRMIMDDRTLQVRVLFGSGLFPCPRRIAAVPAAYQIYFYFF